MSLVDQRSQYDKNYHSFLAGVDLCKRLSGTHSKCHALSLDLSLPRSSREPTCRTDQCIKIHPSLGHMAQSTVPTTQPCPQTQPVSPSTPSVPSSQPRPFDTPQTTSPGGKATLDATRTCGFDLNPHWQEDKDHYDNQKINGLTFPRSIRQSAFTSHKSLTSKGVILCSYLWRPCCISRPTTFGFASWLMVVNST